MKSKDPDKLLQYQKDYPPKDDDPEQLDRIYQVQVLRNQVLYKQAVEAGPAALEAYMVDTTNPYRNLEAAYAELCEQEFSQAMEKPGWEGLELFLEGCEKRRKKTNPYSDCHPVTVTRARVFSCQRKYPAIKTLLQKKADESPGAVRLAPETGDTFIHDFAVNCAVSREYYGDDGMSHSAELPSTEAAFFIRNNGEDFRLAYYNALKGEAILRLLKGAFGVNVVVPGFSDRKTALLWSAPYKQLDPELAIHAQRLLKAHLDHSSPEVVATMPLEIRDGALHGELTLGCLVTGSSVEMEGKHHPFSPQIFRDVFPQYTSDCGVPSSERRANGDPFVCLSSCTIETRGTDFGLKIAPFDEVSVDDVQWTESGTMRVRFSTPITAVKSSVESIAENSFPEGTLSPFEFVGGGRRVTLSATYIRNSIDGQEKITKTKEVESKISWSRSDIPKGLLVKPLTKYAKKYIKALKKWKKRVLKGLGKKPEQPFGYITKIADEQPPFLVFLDGSYQVEVNNTVTALNDACAVVGTKDPSCKDVVDSSTRIAFYAHPFFLTLAKQVTNLCTDYDASSKACEVVQRFSEAHREEFEEIAALHQENVSVLNETVAATYRERNRNTGSNVGGGGSGLQNLCFALTGSGETKCWGIGNSDQQNLCFALTGSGETKCWGMRN